LTNDQPGKGEDARYFRRRGELKFRCRRGTDEACRSSDFIRIRQLGYFQPMPNGLLAHVTPGPDPQNRQLNWMVISSVNFETGGQNRPAVSVKSMLCMVTIWREFTVSRHGYMIYTVV